MQYNRKLPKRNRPKAKSGDSPLQEDKYPEIDYGYIENSQDASPREGSQQRTNVPRKLQEQAEDKTQTERMIDRIKRHPIFTILGALSALIILIEAVTGGLAAIPENVTKFGQEIHLIAPSPIATATPNPVSNSCTNVTRSNQNATSAHIGFTFRTYRVHKGVVSAVAWSPDGKRIASAGADGTVQVRDATTGSNVIIYRGHKGPVYAVAWSPYGQRIASGGVDGEVQVWDPDTGKLDYSYSSFRKVSALAWSPDGQWIAYGTEEGAVEVFDVLNGGMEGLAFSLNPPNKYESVGDLSWSPDSELIAISYSGNGPDNGPIINGRVEIWKQDLSKHIITYNLPSPYIYMGPMAWSPDGKFIAFVSDQIAGLSNSLGVRNVSKGNCPYDSYFNPGIESLSWSCDSKYIALGAIEGLVYLWDVKARKNIYIYQAEVGQVTAVAWSPNGTLIASADDNGTIRVWQASDKKLC